MIVGLPPFFSENTNLMYELISKANLKVPAFVSPFARDLLENLLKRNAEDRLGYGDQDELAIRKHPFFSGTDFDQLLAKEVEPEFKPRLNGQLDASNFDAEFTSERVVDSVVNAPLRDKNSMRPDEFAGWSHAKRADDGSKGADMSDEDDD
jgi:serine/threonine protein kinase